MIEMTHTWAWSKFLGQYKSKPCKLLACGKLNSVLIEFEDGKKFLTLRYGLRRIAPGVSPLTGQPPGEFRARP